MDWVVATRRAPTFMANALDLDSAAKLLLDLGLAIKDEYGICVDKRLIKAGEEANTETLATIARLLMCMKPPPWLRFAVIDGIIRSELMPTDDEVALDWLGELRDPILLDVKLKQEKNQDFLDWLGSVGENIVVESEKKLGRRVIHVSQLSDFFGFDVESRGSSSRSCIEVKTTIESAADHFFITKHEVSKAKTLVDSWILVQIVLHQDAASNSQINRGQILVARYLEATTLLSLIPFDTRSGVWLDSARITPPPEAWSTWHLEVQPSWVFPGYRIDCK